MIYTFIRQLFTFALSEFFERIERKGVPFENGPLLIVSNHPNDLLDPVLIASSYKRRLSFLAKSTIFRGYIFRSFLRSLSLIPLYRKQDAANEMNKNEESFRAVTEALVQGRGILIFPEGTSANERKMAPLKTGAARMALQGEAQNGWNLGVMIQPVGITYSDFESFRSSVTVVFGEPIEIKKYRLEFEKNSFEAAKKLTGEIEDEIEKITVQVSSLEHEKLVDAIASLYRWAGRGESEYELLSRIAVNVEALAPKDLERKLRLEKELSQFLEVASVFPKFSWRVFVRGIVAAPFSALGALLNYMPYRMTGELAGRMKLFGVEIASRKFLGGVIVFVLYYLSITVIFTLLFSSLFWGVAITIAAIVLGQIANRTWWGLSPVMRYGTFASLRSLSESINRRGDALIEELEALRIS